MSCCGTFPELPLLAGWLPGREIVGIDISPGVISRAEQRAAPWPTARAIVQGAAVLDQAWSAACAAVVSVFGLHHLPAPHEAIADRGADTDTRRSAGCRLLAVRARCHRPVGAGGSIDGHADPHQDGCGGRRGMGRGRDEQRGDGGGYGGGADEAHRTGSSGRPRSGRDLRSVTMPRRAR
ncbi:class I SAM-dependent methyltransferase [Streptomyces collinus]|uniref:class I SAM-dependent methyltransferase n=1 Tax=Streptomyces collinus TaxID=42684 RepID=UPI0033D3097B